MTFVMRFVADHPDRIARKKQLSLFKDSHKWLRNRTAVRDAVKRAYHRNNNNSN